MIAMPAGVESDPQLDPGGRLRHLLSLDEMPSELVTELLDTAEAIAAATGGKVKKLPLLRGRTVVNLFFEPSTRTRTSFELAATRLSADVVNFDVMGSSTTKGESLLDTLRTIEAMHCDVFVVRHAENGTPAHLARSVRPGVSVINAGDGNNAHPTQGLLDLFTIRRHKGPDFSKLKVLIVGDIRHSRVARSDVHVLRTLGVRELHLCAPPELAPEAGEFPDCRIVHDFDAAIDAADVIIMLRLQKERMQAAAIPSEADYYRRYGLSPARLARARPECLVMHPGPINRGVEIAADVADGPQSLILEQVANGVYVRMAVLAELLASH